MVRNETVWLEIYNLDVFQTANTSTIPGVTPPEVTELFNWCEKLEKDGRLRQIDLMKLERIIDLAFRIGQQNPAA